MVFELLNKELQKIVGKRFKEPTLPQRMAIKSILEGKNILLLAQVGTGKTESAMLPLLHFVMEQKPNPISILYITPLKSLNRDLLDRLLWWCNEIGIEVSVRHGDTTAYERRQQAEFPPQLLITTPETLQAILPGKVIREHLKNIKWVVIDECLPFDTLITLADGTTKKIGEIVENNMPKGTYETNLNKNIYVKTLDKNSGKIITSKILKVHKIPLHKKMIYLRSKFYNLELSMTPNHPILLLRGKKLEWVTVDNLQISDKITVINPLGVVYKNEKNVEERSTLILDEEKFKKTYLKLFGTKTKEQKDKLEKIIIKLKKKRILPLCLNNSNLPVIARLMGHIFGDGWLTITEKTISVGFSGSANDLEVIKRDLAYLGFASGNVSTRETLSSAFSIKHGKQKIKGISNQIRNGSKTLTTLLVALGTPNGEKTNKSYNIPSWILNASLNIKKEFISSFLGSEMSLSASRKYLDFDAPRISMYKREDMIKSGLKTASQFERIFNDFGVKISDISVKDGNIRKDGSRTKRIVLTISNNEDNLINLFNQIGVRYSNEKENAFILILQYLMSKKFARLNKQNLIRKIRNLKKEGFADYQIGKMLGFDKQLNSKGIAYGHRQSDVIRKLLCSNKKLLRGFPEFKKWKRYLFEDCLIDEIAVIKEDVCNSDFVYDLTIDTTHNFLANNIIVHNCHEIADSKRGTQLTLALERLKALSEHDFQVIGLSATVGSPEEVAKFICPQNSVEIIKAVTSKTMDIKVINPKIEAGDVRIGEKVFTSTETAARLREIMELIKKSRSVLTFTNTREFAEILSSRIKTLDRDFPAGVHHSSLSKDVRIKTEKDFKEEKIKSIISTSSLQLGIDIGSVDLVLQYMSPRTISQCIQRVGRSGHGAEKVSKGIIISTDEDDIFESAVIARKALKEELEPLKFHEKALDVLAHQIVGLTLDYWKIDFQKAYDIVKKAYPYRQLSYEEFMEVCKQLQNLGLVFLNGEIKRKQRGFEYYYSNLSTIPDTKQYRIFNTLDRNFVGVLDEEFIALHGERDTNFIVKGEAWKIIDIQEDQVFVEPVVDIEAAIPGWEGELIPVPFEVAQEVGKVRRIISDGLKKDEDVTDEIKKKYPIDENSARKMVKLVKKQAEYGVVPDDKTILIEDFENTVIIHTCLGSMVNETLGRFIISLLTARLGSVGLRTDPYRIVLEFQAKNLELIKEILKTDPELIRNYLELSLTKSNLFEWKFVHVAKRFGAISRGADYGKIRMGKIIDSYVSTPIYKETMKELEIDKLDIEKTAEVLKKIQKGEIKVVFKSGLSPIGKLGIKRKYAEVVGPERPEVEIFDLFRKRLMNTKVKLVCVNCGQWTRTFSVKELPKEIKCSKCEAKLLGIVHPSRTEFEKLIRKKLRSTKLTDEEDKKFERVRNSADLFLVYGPKAAIALAAKGVGPQTASRILAKFHKTEDDLLRDILEAERLYLKNKRFWKV